MITKQKKVNNRNMDKNRTDTVLRHEQQNQIKAPLILEKEVIYNFQSINKRGQHIKKIYFKENTCTVVFKNSSGRTQNIKLGKPSPLEDKFQGNGLVLLKKGLKVTFKRNNGFPIQGTVSRVKEKVKRIKLEKKEKSEKKEESSATSKKDKYRPSSLRNTYRKLFFQERREAKKAARKEQEEEEGSSLLPVHIKRRLQRKKRIYKRKRQERVSFATDVFERDALKIYNKFSKNVLQTKEEMEFPSKETFVSLLFNLQQTDAVNKYSLKAKTPAKFVNHFWKQVT